MAKGAFSYRHLIPTLWVSSSIDTVPSISYTSTCCRDLTNWFALGPTFRHWFNYNWSLFPSRPSPSAILSYPAEEKVGLCSGFCRTASSLRKPLTWTTHKYKYLKIQQQKYNRLTTATSWNFTHRRVTATILPWWNNLIKIQLYWLLMLMSLTMMVFKMQVFFMPPGILLKLHA